MMITKGLQEQVANLDLLYEVGKKVEAETELSKLLDEIMQMAQYTLKAEASSVLLVDEENGELLFEVAKGSVGEQLKRLKINMQHGIAGLVATHGSPMIVNDVTRDERFNNSIDEYTGFKTKSIICVPLKANGETLGVLEVLNKLDGSDFDDEDLKLLIALASTSALAINNAKLHQTVLSGCMNTIKALASAIDAKDPYTYGHSQRVTEYALMAGASLSLSKQELREIEYGGILHDIGKISVPEAILCKPDALTPEEWSLIRNHPYEGYSIMRHVPFLGEARKLVLYHHEKFNGTGYPDGLSRENIPIGARLIAVADAFDTMTTNRAYRTAIWPEFAIAELRKCAGTQFCPAVVDAFIEGFEKQGNALVQLDSQCCQSELLTQLFTPRSIE